MLCLGRRLDVPLVERTLQRPGDFEGEHRLAGTRLPFDEQRPLERDRRIDGHHEFLRRYVIFRAFETRHRAVTLNKWGQLTVRSALNGAISVRSNERALNYK